MLHYLFYIFTPHWLLWPLGATALDEAEWTSYISYHHYGFHYILIYYLYICIYFHTLYITIIYFWSFSWFPSNISGWVSQMLAILLQYLRLPEWPGSRGRPERIFFPALNWSVLKELHWIGLNCILLQSHCTGFVSKACSIALLHWHGMHCTELKYTAVYWFAVHTIAHGCSQIDGYSALCKSALCQWPG